MAKTSISIETGSRVLDGRLFTPQEPDGSAALFVHGFGSSGRTCEQYAKKIVQRGTTSLTFDLGGHGASGGDNPGLTVNDHLEDASQAYDYLATQTGSDPERIGVAGMSYGGYLAVLLSAGRDIKSLLLRAPPIYPEAFRDQPRRTYTPGDVLASEPDPDNPALAALRAFAGSVLLVTSEHDTVVPARITDTYKSAAPSIEMSMLEGGQHFLDASTQQVFKPMVIGWAEKL